MLYNVHLLLNFESFFITQLCENSAMVFVVCHVTGHNIYLEYDKIYLY